MKALSFYVVASDHARASRLAELCRQALIAEAELTPKPGLVDRRSSGAHTDLSLEIMVRSATAIEPYFCDMAAIASGSRANSSLRERLASIGRDAERAMFEATGGANAHKGAIWILGLLTSAAAMQDEDAAPARAIARTAQCIACFEDRAAPRLVSHGDIVAKKYGVAGARGEAMRGFPHAVEIGLPTLRSGRASGAPENVARLDALLAIMSRLDDTCLLYRGGETALRTVQQGATAVLRAGGCGSEIGAERLRHLDRRLMELRVSPGGSADLLAATLLLDAIERGRNDLKEDTSGIH